MKAQNNSDYGRGGELNTIVGKGSKVSGDMNVTSSLRVDGEVKGNINCTDTVVLGKDGRIEGEIKAKNVMLAGAIVGNIIAEGKVFLESTSSVAGDIKAGRLVVDEGASFDGKCAMKNGGGNVKTK